MYESSPRNFIVKSVEGVCQARGVEIHLGYKRGPRFLVKTSDSKG